MATKVVNDGVQEHQIYDARQVSAGTSTVKLSGGFMFIATLLKLCAALMIWGIKVSGSIVIQ